MKGHYVLHARLGTFSITTGIAFFVGCSNDSRLANRLCKSFVNLSTLGTLAKTTPRERTGYTESPVQP